MRSVGEETLALHLTAYKIPFEREHRFAPPRKWRFDFALPNKIAVEVEGGIWQIGRHQRATGYAKDLEKYNEAAKLGWKVLRYTTDMVSSGRAIDDIRQLVG